MLKLFISERYFGLFILVIGCLPCLLSNFAVRLFLPFELKGVRIMVYKQTEIMPLLLE